MSKNGIWRWRRRISPGDEEQWYGRLTDKDPTRLMVNEYPDRKFLLIDYYPMTRSEGLEMVAEHGGQLTVLDRKSWWLPQEPRAEPLRIGSRLLVVASPEQKKYWTKKVPARPVLLVPASLAFGTGEHATTALMLRSLAKIKDWEHKSMLDAGTGTGILALAARAMGCRKLMAFDNDPKAIEVARLNDATNQAGRTPVAWKVMGVEKLPATPQYDVVCANIYSEILIRQSSRLKKALAPGGDLLVSGIFRDQVEEVIGAFRKTGLKLREKKRSGKWWTVWFRE